MTRITIHPILPWRSPLYFWLCCITAACFALGASAEGPEARPVSIFIPGTQGSRMYHPPSGKMVWGRLVDLFFRTDRKDDLNLPVAAHPMLATDTLRPCGLLHGIKVIPKIYTYDLYGGLMKSLVDAGIVGGDIRNPKPGETLYAFDYDWRKDNVLHASDLLTLLDGIRTAHGKPDLLFNVVCHSNGGHIARYLVKYGREDVVDEIVKGSTARPNYSGAAYIHRVILIANAYGGALNSLPAFVRGISRASFGRRYDADLIASMPGLYCELPFYKPRPFVTEDGTRLDLDIYDVKTWRENEWGIFNPRRPSGRVVRALRDRFSLRQCFTKGSEEKTESFRMQQALFFESCLNRAVAFHTALRQTGQPPGHLEYFAFHSKTTPTVSDIPVRRYGKTWQPIFRVVQNRRFKVPNAERYKKPGDEYMTTDSQDSLPDDERAILKETIYLDGVHRLLLRLPKLRRKLVELITEAQ